MASTTPLRMFKEDVAWVQANCKIITKRGELKHLVPNAGQKRLIAACIRQLTAGRPIRMIVLKARQLGFTTFIQALIHARTFRRTGVKAVLITHQDDSKHKIWQMQVVFTQAGNRDEFCRSLGKAEGPLIWAHLSSINAMTAGGKHIAHGETITVCHYSEASRYGEGGTVEQQEQVKQMIVGVNSAIAKTPDSMVFIESTANGYGNWFQREWQRAKDGENDFVPLFIPWFTNPEYALELGKGPISRLSDLNAEEAKLQAEYRLSLEQLNWRRWVINNEFGGDERLFREQYPSNDREAFLVTGSNVFDPELIEKYLKLTRPPIWQGDFQFDPPRGWVKTADPKGPVKIWKMPDPARSYVIAADTAECLDKLSDRDAGVVRDARSTDVVALIAGHFSVGDYARKLAALGWFYHEALLAPERNGPGIAVIGCLRGTLGGEEMYSNLYRYRRKDKSTGRTSYEYGYPTQKVSKREAVEVERELLRWGTEGNPSEEILLEARTFINKPNGRIEAEEGARDDLVLAWIISAAVADAAPVDRRAEFEINAERIDQMLEEADESPLAETVDLPWGVSAEL